MATTPYDNGIVGWVTEPTTRGTASLLFSCVSTILICTWSALHLDVPLRQDASAISLFLRKVVYLIFALLAPEMVALIAFWDWAGTRKLTEDMRTHVVGSEWSSTLSFFVVMHGVRVQYPSGKMLPLPASGAHKFLRNDWVDLSVSSLEAVKDKSKASGFSKSVASAQITWFLCQLIGRAAARMTITPLELFTLAYIVCASATYTCWWSKPFDVEVALVLPTEPCFPPGQERHYRKRFRKVIWWQGLLGDGLNENLVGIRFSWNFFMLVCALFGACHLAGWNAHFATPVERLLWRIGSVICTCLPLITILLPKLMANFDWEV
ncbi:hypothetical protein K491DRAFT_638730, partial [Lophiostoma macrostomum CBS 122681]